MLAQNLDAIQSGGLPGIKVGSVGGIISALLPFVFYGSAIALLVYLTLGGFQLMLSRGDPKAISAAQAKITSALIGFLIILLAYALVVLLARVLGLTDITAIFGGIQQQGGSSNFRQ